MPSEQEAWGRGVAFFFRSFREGLEAWGWEKRTEFPKKGGEEEGCRIRTLVNLKSTMVSAAGSALPYPTICLRANGTAEALAIGRTLP